MKKIQSTLLASSLIAALFFSTAYAATSNAEENPHKMRDLVESYQAENNEDSNITPMGKGMHSRMEKKGGPWKLLAELTGKNAKDIRQDCHTNHKSPYAYAKENGVEVQFQAKQLTAVKEGLNRAVADNKVSQEAADAALGRFLAYQKDQLDGKEMSKPGHGPMMMGEGRKGMPSDEKGKHHFANPMTEGLMPFDTLAKLTGKDVKELMETCRPGEKTCYDVAKENGVLDQYKEGRIAANKEILAKLVTAGEITQEKADQILAKVEKNISENKPERRAPHNGPMGHGPNRGPQAEE